jgi:hypothetical protein
MEISINDISDISEISPHEFNVANVNSIIRRHGALRSKSKAPT